MPHLKRRPPMVRWRVMGELKPAFHSQIRPRGKHVEVHGSGYLDAAAAERYLGEVEHEILRLFKAAGGKTRISLLFYDNLAGFEAGRVARLHGQWFEKMRNELGRVAVVSQKTTVILAMSIIKLFAKSPVRQFSDEVAALRWLEES